MLVSKWTPILEDAQPEITKMPMWITIKRVPHSMFSWKGLGFLASKVGEPKRLHLETKTCKSFEEAKVFVEVNMIKDLPKHFKRKWRLISFTLGYLLDVQLAANGVILQKVVRLPQGYQF